ncbi:MAG: YwqI/YxiC family protein [Coriobacteriia bacterium]|nr:YwqI/YxiC family protein [Coriobacteriia bacterium]
MEKDILLSPKQYKAYIERIKDAEMNIAPQVAEIPVNITRSSVVESYIVRLKEVSSLLRLYKALLGNDAVRLESAHDRLVEADEALARQIAE